jgi:hypothetical protein
MMKQKCAVKILEKTLRLLLATFLCLHSAFLYAQEPQSALLLDFKYGFQAPFADLRDRFGGNNDFGLGVEVMSQQLHQFAGVEGFFFFGNNVKEDVLQPLRTYDGSILGIDGHVGDVNLKERGFYVGLHAGKIFSTTDNKSSFTGIRTQLGFGFLQHKIRVQDNFRTIIPLEKKYLQGYDRLTNGIAAHLAIGYQYDSPHNNFHFKIMGDLVGGPTKSRRDYDYATGSYLDKSRFDVLAGLHISYIVSISRTRTEEFIYY